MSNRPFCINENNSQLFPYRNHAYHVYKPETDSLNKSHLQRIISSYETMLSHYNTVFVLRIDLRPNQYSNSNIMVTFLNRLHGYLTQHYKSKVMYHCAREIGKRASKEHYHLVLMLSAHKVRHSHKIQTLVQRLWSDFCGGSAVFVESPYCIVHRGNKASLKEAIYRSSYLAKNATKETKSKLRSFICNKLEPSRHWSPESERMLVNPDITRTNNTRKLEVQKYQAAAEKCFPSSASRDFRKFGWRADPQESRKNTRRAYSVSANDIDTFSPA